MNRRRLSWLVAVSLASIGSVAAHSLGLLHHAAEKSEQLGEPTAHDPIRQVPLLAGLLATVVLIGLATRAWSAVRHRPAGPPSPAWFAAVPLLGWAAQEAVERLLRVESFPFSATREPAFLKGLAVQVLFGLLALLLARLLLACISELHRHRQPHWWPREARDVAGVAPACHVVVRPRQLALVRGYDERGPPPRR